MALQQFDDLWFKTTLSEQAENRVLQYLKKNHPEYLEMRTKAADLVEQCPTLGHLLDCKNAISLTAEEHDKLHKYFQLESDIESLERAYLFFIGQAMAFSYSGMLAQLRKESLSSGDGTANHLIDILAKIRADEAEEQHQEESLAYRNSIAEATQCESSIKDLKLSPDILKAVECYVTAINNRWLLHGEYLYRAGMKDMLLLLENS